MVMSPCEVCRTIVYFLLGSMLIAGSLDHCLAAEPGALWPAEVPPEPPELPDPAEPDPFELPDELQPASAKAPAATSTAHRPCRSDTRMLAAPVQIVR
jgi:hypothetical protein